MLISRKNSGLKRIITDFRFFNSRLQSINLAFPLIRDTFSILGSSKCECSSVLDLKDAYHTIKSSENSKPYCGILPYFGSATGIEHKFSYTAILHKCYSQEYT